MSTTSGEGGARGTVLFLSTNPEAPSFRYRLAPLLPLLRERGWQVDIVRLPEQQYGWRLWSRRHALRSSSALVLHKLRLPAWESRWLRAMQPASVFDVDDAIWLRQPKYVGHQRPVSGRRQRSFDGMCAHAGLTTVGNEVLAQAAVAAGGRVQIVPTPIDAADYPVQRLHDGAGQTVVWVGMPGNLQYLAPLRPVLARLAVRYPDFRLRVISSAWPDWDDVPMERVVWSAATEKSQLASADVGIMPLSDDPFSRGKCAFKLLQYMAAGLPCVASPVGANNEVVVAGQTGYLADGPQAWEAALDALLSDAALRHRLGQAGRVRAMSDYDMGVICPRMVALIEGMAASGRPAVASQPI